MTPEHKDTVQRTCADVARELLEQPALFSEFDGIPGLSPPSPETLARYNGARSTGSQHEERNLKVGALRLLGASDREIEQACGVTRRTIPLILTALEKAGRITPLKDRLAQLCGDNAERANIALRMLLDQVGDNEGSVELASMIKAVSTSLGITTEKVLLLTGQATEIVETRGGAGRAEFDAWWQQTVIPIAATVTPATDSDSSASLPVSEQRSAAEPPRDGPDTAGRGPESERLDEGDRGGGDGRKAGGPETPMS